jgi:uncharacterized membrane protein YccC
MIRVCRSAIRSLVALPAASPSLRLLADRTAEALSSVLTALGGLVLLHDPGQAVLRSLVARAQVPDLLPPVLSGVRATATIAFAAVFWIVTAWPGGGVVTTFAAITVIISSSQAPQVYAAAMAFLFGITLGAILAAVVGFAVLPSQSGGVEFSLALGMVFVPVGALSAGPWQSQIFFRTAAYFLPLLAPANQMSYDIQHFYNAAVAIIVGTGMAVIAICLIPPLSPAMQTRRLLALTLRDLKQLAAGTTAHSPREWERRVYIRLAALPDQQDLVPASQLAAALCVGTGIVRLRRIAERSDVSTVLDSALTALVQGDSETAIQRLGWFDDALTAIPADRPGATARMRARGTALAVSEALAAHGEYFDWR